MNDLERKTFMAGYSCGYARGQSDAGEGAYWLTPLGSDEAWMAYSKLEKIKKPKHSSGLSKDNFRGVRNNDPRF